MRFTALKLNSLRDLFIEELRDLYSAETQLVDALPKMAEAAASEELVYRLVNNGDVVAFKMGRRQGARRAHI